MNYAEGSDFLCAAEKCHACVNTSKGQLSLGPVIVEKEVYNQGRKFSQKLLLPGKYEGHVSGVVLSLSRGIV